MVGLDGMRGGPTRGLHPAALCCLGLAIASLACIEKVRDPRPGIVVLIADDHAAESLGEGRGAVPWDTDVVHWDYGGFRSNDNL